VSPDNVDRAAPKAAQEAGDLNQSGAIMMWKLRPIKPMQNTATVAPTFHLWFDERVIVLRVRVKPVLTSVTGTPRLS
jgi:hypothetical protein